MVPAPPAYYFDLSDPFSYLATERVERTLGEVDWVAVDPHIDGHALVAEPRPGRAMERLRGRAEARAAELRLPLVWPEPFPCRAPAATRAAAYACELGAGAAFALAASRLAFCGGFPLEDPEVIAEAAAAAAVPLGPCLQAARGNWHDAELRDHADGLRSAGVTRLPSFQVAGEWCEGEDELLAAAALIADSEPLRRPLAPFG
jgi:2-hydroxychromene-2-carboxylate isomerase